MKGEIRRKIVEGDEAKEDEGKRAGKKKKSEDLGTQAFIVPEAT
jgi:hypothetical protein